MTLPLGQQVVVITRASSGMGRETALQLAQRGALITAVARGRRALETRKLAIGIAALDGLLLAVRRLGR